MGELLKGVKKNLLSNKKNSFNIGFSNPSSLLIKQTIEMISNSASPCG